MLTRENGSTVHSSELQESNVVEPASPWDYYRDGEIFELEIWSKAYNQQQDSFGTALPVHAASGVSYIAINSFKHGEKRQQNNFPIHFGAIILY